MAPKRKPKKRGQGEGSISQLANGKYVVRVLAGRNPTTGKPVYKSVTCATMREATQILTQLNHDKQAGVSLLSDRVTVGTYLTYWLDEVVQRSRRPATYVMYEKLLRLHVLPHIGHLQLAKLRTEHLQRLVNAKLDTTLAPATVHRIRAILRTALEHAVQTRRLQHNPAAGVEMKKVTHPPIKFFTPTDARSFLLVARQDRLAAAWFVALLGLREGELLGLQWQDVDLAQGLLHVRQQLTLVGGKPTLTPLKTEGSARTLPLPAFFVTLLEQHRAAQAELRHWNASRWQDSPLVFTSTIGTPLLPRSFLRRYHALLTAAGLERRRFHDLRHSCASLLTALGVQPKVIQMILGHTSLQMTDHYTHVYDASVREALGAFGKLLTETDTAPVLEVDSTDNERF